MKLMIISDIHGSAAYLRKVLSRFEAEKPDQLILLGDILYHGPRNPIPEGYDPKETVELLNPLKERIVAVKGNCDSEVDQMLLQFPIMAEYCVILLEKRKIFLTHGHHHPMDQVPLEKGSIYLYGHTHIPMAEAYEDAYCLNPGSITLPKNGHPNTYGILTQEDFIVKNLQGDNYMHIVFS